MPDLGQYSLEVLSAYAISLSFLGILIGATVFKSRRERAALAKVEAEVRQ